MPTWNGSVPNCARRKARRWPVRRPSRKNKRSPALPGDLYEDRRNFLLQIFFLSSPHPTRGAGSGSIKIREKENARRSGHFSLIYGLLAPIAHDAEQRLEQVDETQVQVQRGHDGQFLAVLAAR